INTGTESCARARNIWTCTELLRYWAPEDTPLPVRSRIFYVVRARASASTEASVLMNSRWQRQHHALRPVMRCLLHTRCYIIAYQWLIADKRKAATSYGSNKNINPWTVSFFSVCRVCVRADQLW